MESWAFQPTQSSAFRVSCQLSEHDPALSAWIILCDLHALRGSDHINPLTKRPHLPRPLSMSPFSLCTKSSANPNGLSRSPGKPLHKDDDPIFTDPQKEHTTYRVTTPSPLVVPHLHQITLTMVSCAPHPARPRNQSTKWPHPDINHSRNTFMLRHPTSPCC